MPSETIVLTQSTRCVFRMQKVRFSFFNFILGFCLSIPGLTLAHANQTQSKREKPAASADRPLSSSALDLESFLNQVRSQHDGFKSTELGAQAARLQAEESSLLLKPAVFGSASANASGQTDPIGNSNRFRSRSYSLGVKQTSSFGLSGQITVNQTNLSIPGFNPSGYDALWGQLELSQSLLRNWAGREVLAQTEAGQASALARAHHQLFMSRQILLDAEAAYWRLALVRELVKVQRDAVNRSQRIMEWAARRSKLQLSDRAELLQASTALQARRLELRTAEDEERAAAQAFNSARGINSNTVAETLTEIRPDLIAQMSAPRRTESRDDVKSAEQQVRATRANALASKERNKSSLEIFASLPLNEPSEPSGALSALLPASARPSTTVGLRFAAPLDFSSREKIREGFSAEAAAADAQFKRKRFDEERDWADLTAKFNQTRDRLQLFIELESVQREKLNYERERQSRGRSTLQQVLIYENDYEQAQLGRIRTLTELLTLAAQMKLYGVSYESR